MNMNNSRIWHCAIAGFGLVVSMAAQANITWQGKVQASAFERDDSKSWLNHGWGNQRFDKEAELIEISRAWVDVRAELGMDWSAHVSAQYVPDPSDKIGVTEAFLKYNPLTNNPYQWNVKLGGFYPAMSMENPQVGWSSPYTYSFSGINAWLGEEVRTFGAEFEISRLGKRFRSPHDVSVHAAFFKGNDPAGTMLAWRGFASHDRQSMFNESVYFPPVRSLNEPQLRFQAPQVKPFSEVDGKWGYYFGVHWDYQKQQQLKVYWYDNQGDPAAINKNTGQYAWDTKFLSVAWLYKFNKQTRLIAQWLDGSTAMGKNRGVNNDFSSYYVLLSHKMAAHRFSGRVERSKVTDKDTWAFDPNTSDTDALTLTYRYQFDKHWQSGVEWLYQKSDVENRSAAALPEQVSQSQWRFVTEYSF
ncbi:hypothetical protein [Pseudoalteromonas xiamenensis]|uniref:Porin n=1 Tax=Pseudoalteromonas xiamenensis TaxID=882626 RepID=A0A975DK89_9GAMM|nr:hypothetical protein [Pseudoalteromonas xiamenensis]QTH72727.1 hypothetical protein J5O05_08130 [Pseudoalteromonas xiamenensis]